MSSRKLHHIALICSVVAVFMLSSCASGPKVRTDSAAGVSFSDYKTFGFFSELATDKAGYTTLVTQNFKYAITDEMTKRGYRYSESNPDLLINFNSNVQNRTEIRSTPTAHFHYGYYNYRYGLYGAYPLYAQNIDTVHYKIGTVNIDIVDTAKKQLVWEGLSEGILKEKDLQQPKEAILRVTNLIFQKYPVQLATP